MSDQNLVDLLSAIVRGVKEFSVDDAVTVQGLEPLLNDAISVINNQAARITDLEAQINAVLTAPAPTTHDTPKQREIAPLAALFDDEVLQRREAAWALYMTYCEEIRRRENEKLNTEETPF